jgi:cytochrome c peroxidase
LITPNAPFDRFLRGQGQLSAQQHRGYETFRDYGCISCHQGKNVGGNMYQRFGIMRDYFADRGEVVAVDFGRYSQTQLEDDRFVFRVPSLRNVALTAPYFHDGSADTLEEAVTTMARYQLGRALAAEQADDIAAFLGTLTGEYRGRPL